MAFDTIHLDFSNSNHSQNIECSIANFQVRSLIVLKQQKGG